MGGLGMETYITPHQNRRDVLISNSPAPAAPTKIDSRGLTRGGYRGYGESYDYTIPSGTIISGTNTVTINAISGSSGDAFLGPNFVSTLALVDCGHFLT